MTLKPEYDIGTDAIEKDEIISLIDNSISDCCGVNEVVVEKGVKNSEFPGKVLLDQIKEDYLKVGWDTFKWSVVVEVGAYRNHNILRFILHRKKQEEEQKKWYQF